MPSAVHDCQAAARKRPSPRHVKLADTATWAFGNATSATTSQACDDKGTNDGGTTIEMQKSAHQAERNQSVCSCDQRQDIPTRAPCSCKDAICHAAHVVRSPALPYIMATMESNVVVRASTSCVLIDGTRVRTLCPLGLVWQPSGCAP